MAYGPISQGLRKKTATFGGDRFPMPDKKHARLALQMLPRAKNISSAQEAQVRSRAQGMLSLRKAAAKKALAK